MKCTCFGESGLHGSTHRGANDERCCDLCGHPLAAFVREERYIVVKRKGLDRRDEEIIRGTLGQLSVPIIECVVVESDWPEYESVWSMIEARCAK